MEKIQKKKERKKIELDISHSEIVVTMKSRMTILHLNIALSRCIMNDRGRMTTGQCMLEVTFSPFLSNASHCKCFLKDL